MSSFLSFGSLADTQGPNACSEAGFANQEKRVMRRLTMHMVLSVLSQPELESEGSQSPVDARQEHMP
jgi:hypothetical protein